MVKRFKIGPVERQESKKSTERVFKITQKEQGQTIFLTKQELAEQRQHYPPQYYTIEVVVR